MKTLVSPFVLGSLIFALEASASPPNEALVRAISLVDQVPTKAQLVALGADPEGRTISEIARDPARPVYTRIRAVSFLAWFDSGLSRRALFEIAMDEGAEVLELRVQALRSMAVMEGPAARSKIEPFRSHSSAELRAAAYRALALMAESPSVVTGAGAPKARVPEQSQRR